ncbi:MAG: glutamine-hydrolyzing carbamoyl-phosphate synthase small subunit [Aquihabitans sp.]
MSGLREAHLVLADGTTFEGEAIGADAPNGIATGEVVFNTVMSGYQEVLSDPSYAGQIINFTYPHIGNYGVTPDDDESRKPFCRGLVVREPARRRSNWRATEDLDDWLVRFGIPGIAGVDTRRLTRHLRDAGSMPGAFGTAGHAALLAAAQAEPGTDGVDLVAKVTTDRPYTVGSTDAPFRVVAFDFGIKTTILRHLARMAQVEVVPASTTAAEVLALNPDGVFLSNGPGDPGAVPYATEAIRGLLGEVPMFGICLGHQLMATALGGTVEKMPFGHHGGNHPVRRVSDGLIEITSQNHNFAVVEATSGIEVTHINLNDGVIEGISAPALGAFSVQHHPEAGPGPRDSGYLFEEFADLMEQRRSGTAASRDRVTPRWSGYLPAEPDGLLEGHLRRDDASHETKGQA